MKNNHYITVQISQELYNLFLELVDECNTYDGLDENNVKHNYGRGSVLGDINAILKKAKENNDK